MKKNIKYSVIIVLYLGLIPIFHSCKKEEVPTLTTDAITNVTNSGATCGGNITSEGTGTVINRGVCWSITNSNPTITNNKTFDGSGTGSFISSVTGLNGGTKYYIRAYATNSSGTGYGNIITFTTNDIPKTVTDIDSNIYNVVTIGTQIWMKENLKVSRYRNGDPILTGLSDSNWSTTTSGAYTIYNNDNLNNVTYGKIYNWYSVSDNRQLCPTGWHVPSDYECNQLAAFADPDGMTTDLTGIWISNSAGAKLKEAGTLHWLPPNSDATNQTGFTALPSGLVGGDGQFYWIGTFTDFWTSTEYTNDTTLVWFIELNCYNPGIWHYHRNKVNGISVRCILDN